MAVYALWRAEWIAMRRVEFDGGDDDNCHRDDNGLSPTCAYGFPKNRTSPKTT